MLGIQVDPILKSDQDSPVAKRWDRAQTTTSGEQSRGFATTCAVVAVFALSVGLVVGLGGRAPANAATCPADVFFIGARGSGESYGSTGFGGVVGGVYDKLAAEMKSKSYSLKPIGVNYPAGRLQALAQGKFDDSLDDGVAAVLSDFKTVGRFLERPECANSQVVVAGYSQGAMVMHLALLEIAISADKDYARVLSRLGGALLIADGFKVAADKGGIRLGSGSTTDRNGIATPKDYPPFPQSIAGKIVSVCALGDAVCDPWWVTNAVGVSIHTKSYNLTGKSQSGYLQAAVNIVSINVETAIESAKAKNRPRVTRTTTSPTKITPPASSTPTLTPTSPPPITPPTIDCTYTETPVIGSCIGEATYAVGQPLSEGATIYSDRAGRLFATDSAGREALRQLGYTVSDDGTGIAGTPNRTGSVLISFTGPGPDGSPVTYRGRINVVAASVPSARGGADTEPGSSTLIGESPALLPKVYGVATSENSPEAASPHTQPDAVPGEGPVAATETTASTAPAQPKSHEKPTATTPAPSDAQPTGDFTAKDTGDSPDP